MLPDELALLKKNTSTCRQFGKSIHTVRRTSHKLPTIHKSNAYSHVRMHTHTHIHPDVQQNLQCTDTHGIYQRTGHHFKTAGFSLKVNLFAENMHPPPPPNTHSQLPPFLQFLIYVVATYRFYFVNTKRLKPFQWGLLCVAVN